MKKGKLLLLLVAILSLAVIFVSCDQTGEDDTGTLGTDAAEETIAEVKEEQVDPSHEMNKYFDLAAEDEADTFAEISRIDGKVLDWDEEHNLVAVETKELDNMNNVITTVNIYDLKTGEVIRSETVTNPYLGDDEDIEVLDVSIEYPVIRVSRKTHVGWDNGADPYKYDVSYYMACTNGELIHNTTDESFNNENDIKYYGNGLVSIKMGDKVVWIDKDLNVIRSIAAISAGGYDTDEFDSEYKGYLYSWNESELLIFNRKGVVSGKYLAGENGILNVVVLNNGNALIQEFTEVSIYDSCDFVLSGKRYTMKSNIMNFIDGSLTEVDIDFIVDYNETAYYQKNNDAVTLVLNDGYENLADIYRVANGGVSASSELCVLDNEANVIYTVKNDTFGVNLSWGVYPMGNYYTAYVERDGIAYLAIFDLDGNLVSDVIDLYEMTDKYIVSNSALYDYRMNKVYDFAAEGYSFDYIADDNIYLVKNNFVTGLEENYVIKADSKAPELFFDAEEYEFSDMTGVAGAYEGFYILKDLENDVFRLYTTEGEELLVSHENIEVTAICEDVVIISSTFNGEEVVYVIK